MNLKILITALTVILYQPVTGNMLLSQSDKAEKQQTAFNPLQETKPEVSLITVFDNFLFKPELKTAWGFSCIIKTPDEVILFDTGGNSKILLQNMHEMNIDPGSISKVIDRKSVV